MLINQRWHYVKRPETKVGFEHYQLVETPVPQQLAQGEVLIENHYLSVDPYMRIQQSANPSWEAPHPLNSLQQGGIVGKVIKTNSTKFQIGDWVTAYTGWEQYSLAHELTITKLDANQADVTSALGVLGMPGRTAWFGLMEAGKPKAGETVVVSGASGAVGSLVVQFAKKAGCKVIAFAGSDEKCQFLTQKLGADQAINYKNFNNYQQLQQYLTDHKIIVDVYFDNVGGLITDAIMPCINKRARIIICGQMSQYNGGLDHVELAPRFLHHMLYQRATIQGILARDYTHRMDEMLNIVAPWLSNGELIFDQTIVDGFDQMPAHLASLFHRNSHGKLIVKIK